MTLEDPFYVVKDEVFKALNKTRGLYLRWQELAAAATPSHSPEVEWTLTELKNALRSIQWDLEDLEDTISIVEKNSSKFKIDIKEITDRRKFIDNTRKEVKSMHTMVYKHDKRAGAAWRRMNRSPSPPTPEQWMATRDHRCTPQEEAITPLIPRWSSSNLARSLLHEFDDAAAEDALALQASSKQLKQVSISMSDEINEQQILMEEMNLDMEETGSQLESASPLSARFLRTTSGYQQRWVFASLLLLLGVIGLLFFLL